MQKYFLNILLVLFASSLLGCQSNHATSNLFKPFSSPRTQGANLAQSVHEALMRQEDPVMANVSVQTTQDVVILTGYVKKIRQSDTAEQIARQVPGVRSVENNIIIRP